MLPDINYRFFFFCPITYAEFLANFALDPEVVKIGPGAVYGEWLAEFNKQSSVFYKAQYKRYRFYVTRGFNRQYGLREEDEPDDYGLGEEWRAWREQAELQERWDDTRQAMGCVEQVYGAKAEAHHWSEDLAEIVDVYLDMLPVLPRINALWFNGVIHNSPGKAAELHALPYADYRQTEHWRRVRAAMLLIHRAVCQEGNHWEMGESWYFGNWETDIHVHHLNYTHWGNERYEDLVLLCADHHQKWHENMDKFRDPKFELVLS